MSLVAKFAHLPGLPRSNESEPLLQKIASQVKPIMSKRGWKVGTLGEFIPQNPALLGININRGQRINLRLRPHGNTSTFYDYDQLVLVMLHELTHIVHGPHDASFYKLLSELEDEYYSLKQKGYSGEGFHSDGNKVNGLRLNEYEGRRRGLAAAEKRLNTQIRMGRGGILGGSPVTGKSLREVLAEAAERRLKDDQTCRVNNEEAEEESRKAQEASIVTDASDVQAVSVQEIVDLTLSEDSGDDAATSSVKPSNVKAIAPKSFPTSSENNTSLKREHDRPRNMPATLPSQSAQPIPPKRLRSTAPTTTSSLANTALPPRELDKWSCDTCTLLNPIRSTTCEACLTPRLTPSVTSEGWFCDFCGSGPRDMDYWSCAECGSVRRWG